MPDLPHELPPGLEASRLEHEGEELVVFSHPIDPPVVGSLLGALAERLTPAQAEVAALSLEGHANAEIARRRGTSERTVAKQLEQVYRRLEINSRLELAALAGEHRSAPRTDG